ncbi:hypothetical protein L207DRAFT_584446 [Hyaloscypha variabilis F]|uniref:Uncharacterized protein n=1 Tax=Hyaloscypha variabilis (strain UAMH 11265 / GT02V1 / F) TaxID=1149755 RepID=A0A2J6RKJ7_HYAVF|nr:hypothetical protein L207DRAFT_584446 [Hyaloscypha variabilis F]
MERKIKSPSGTYSDVDINGVARRYIRVSLTAEPPQSRIVQFKFQGDDSSVPLYGVGICIHVSVWTGKIPYSTHFQMMQACGLTYLQFTFIVVSQQHYYAQMVRSLKISSFDNLKDKRGEAAELAGWREFKYRHQRLFTVPPQRSSFAFSLIHSTV